MPVHNFEKAHNGDHKRSRVKVESVLLWVKMLSGIQKKPWKTEKED